MREAHPSQYDTTPRPPFNPMSSHGSKTTKRCSPAQHMIILHRTPHRSKPPTHLLPPTSPPPRPKYLRRNPTPRPPLRILQPHPLLPLHIDRQHAPLPLLLTRPLRQMHMRDTLPPRALDVEAKPQVLRPPLVRFLRRGDKPVARQPRPRGFAVGADFGAGSEQALALGVGADGGRGAVEVGGFGGGGEDVGEEEVGYATLEGGD